MILFTQPLRSGRIWHKVNFFKRSLTGLNSEFSFSKTSCLTKAEEPSLPWRENNWIHTFPNVKWIHTFPYVKCNVKWIHTFPYVKCNVKWIHTFPYVKCNQSCTGFELVSPCPYPVTITITPRAPLFYRIIRCSLVSYQELNKAAEPSLSHNLNRAEWGEQWDSCIKSWTPTNILVVTTPPACHLHVARGHAFF